jgi:twitching motility protein PilT
MAVRTIAAARPQRPSLQYLVEALIKFSASDLHVKVGRPPIFRINGKLVPAKMDALSTEDVEGLLMGLLSSRQKKELDQKLQVDLSVRIGSLGRFRCNIYHQRNTLSAAIRMIPFQIPRLEDLGVPPVLKELIHRQNGILLITGGTGSGKSTTLAAAVQHLNETQPIHILTIEDPIEFVYRDMRASVTQRELGTDALSLHEALYAGLRQDPDVVVVGEMRDYETMRVALTAAETGHLVLSTLHTSDARGTIERILDMVPAAAQNQIRIQLANSLIGVFSQQLVMRADKKGRVLAAEVLVNSPAMENLIHKNEVEQIRELIANSNHYYQMQTMNQALLKLCESGVVSQSEASKCSPEPDELNQMLSGIVRD